MKSLRLAATALLSVGLAACEGNSVNHNESKYDDATAETRLSNGFNGDPTIWPVIDSMVKPDAEIEARIDRIMSRMTLEHKVAQMVQGELRHVRPEHVVQYRLGSVLNGGGSHPHGDRYATVEDWLDIADGYWEASMTDDLEHEPIPLMWGTDAVHGHNNVVGAVLFPHNFGLGAARNPRLMNGIGQATARQVIATGIDWTFAPTVAVAMDYRWGRSYESYGQDPDMVSQYAYEMVASIQGETDETRFSDGYIISSIKHFVGDGGTQGGLDQGDTQLTEQQLFDIHAQGYVGGLKAGAQTVMASFNSWNGDKLHGHHYLLTTVLKERMGFDGFVVGDWNGHGHVPGCSNDHCAAAINAGVDMIMVPDDWEAFLLNTIDDVREGRIEQSRIDDAVRRILRVKLRAGMFERAKPSERKYAGDRDVLWGDEIKTLARDAVRQSLVLLKNNNDALPLLGGERILVIGDGVNDISRQMGGWSITWQGTETNQRDFPNATSIADGLINGGIQKGSNVVIAESIDDVEGQFDKVIVIFGETPYAEFNGDRSHLVYHELDPSAITLLEKVRSHTDTVVSVYLSGRPMFANKEINASDAFVAAWLPGTEGQGVSDVLWGDHDFSGRLPGVWPLSAVDQNLALQIGEGGSYNEQPPIAGQLDDSYEIDASSEVFDVFTGTLPANLSLEMDEASVSLVDRLVQEDTRRFRFDSQQSEVRFALAEPTNLTFFRRYDARVKFFMRVQTAPENASLNLGLNSQMPRFDLDADQLLASNGWVEWSIPLYCLAPDVASLMSVTSPFVVMASEGVVIDLSQIRWEFGGESHFNCANTWAGDNHRAPIFSGS